MRLALLPVLVLAALPPGHGGAPPGRAASPPPRHPALHASIPLPSTSPWALPPIMRLRARPGSSLPGGRGALGRRVLRDRRLLVAPAPRRAIRAGRVGPGALSLLLRLPRGNAPYLVFRAGAERVRVQATTLRTTRLALRSIVGTPAARRPQLELRQEAPGANDQPAPHGGAIGAQAVGLARRFIGVPYVWGGAAPGGFDCSGLTMYVYARLGIKLDHYAAFQFYEGTRVTPAELEPGDLVFFEPTVDGPGHVGIYAGNGWFIHAPHTGDVVRMSRLDDRRRVFVGAIRPA